MSNQEKLIAMFRPGAVVIRQVTQEKHDAARRLGGYTDPVGYWLVDAARIVFAGPDLEEVCGRALDWFHLQEAAYRNATNTPTPGATP